MNRNINIRPKWNHRLFDRLTGLLLSFAAADAAYILGIVVRMTENTALAQARYHSVPLMIEHILAAVILYLVCMVLIHREIAKNSEK